MIKVSIIVPNYNHYNFLEARINSILKQTYQNFEIIILDDYSTDQSRDIIEKYREISQVSHIIYNTKNSGSTFTQWNKGVTYAQGEYIWIAESDDTADLLFLEKMVTSLDQNHNIVLAYSQSNRMNDKNEITGTWLEWTDSIIFKNNFCMQGTDYIKNFLIFKNTIPNASAVLFRKDTFMTVEGANTKLLTNGDWHLWLKIITQGQIFYTHECLNNFRYHSNSVIAKAHKSFNKVDLKKTQVYLRKDLAKFLFKENLNLYQLNRLLLIKDIFKLYISKFIRVIMRK